LEVVYFHWNPHVESESRVSGSDILKRITRTTIFAFSMLLVHSDVVCSLRSWEPETSFSQSSEMIDDFWDHVGAGKRDGETWHSSL
jgi:hypothetical protein